MDAAQAVGALLQGAQILLQGVEALSRAVRDLQEAPAKVAQLEETLRDLSTLHQTLVRNYSAKLHHQELYSQLTSFEKLIRDSEVHVSRAKKLVSRRRRGFRVIKVVVTAVTGDELSDIVKSMNTQLVEWIQKNSLKANINKAFEKTAEKLTSYLRVQAQAGYRPLSKKVFSIRGMLEQNTTNVVLIHGLSGMGKSCLARYVAADPPKRFNDGAVDLVLGQSCSRTASLNNRQEYQSRLAAKFSRLLRALGRKKNEVDGIDLDDACQLLQETLAGRSILLVLDDVWEPDIIARFTRLYDNECCYLATTRNQSVYETIEAEKVEITQEDVRELSRAILLQHSQLSEDVLPEAADLLIERCGHHPLTLAVIGKALRKETRAEQWEKAIDDLSTYAAQAIGSIHYLNEKEVESAATVFGSFDYSLNSMDQHAKELFISLGALSWSCPIPETCLEAVWVSLEQQNQVNVPIFRMVSTKLCESSLLQRVSEMFYRVHDMVALYLGTKVDEAVSMILRLTNQEQRAAVVPWLCRFGHGKAKRLAEEALVEVFWSNNEELPTVLLENIVDVVSASNTMSELEETSVNFSRLIGHELARLFLLQSEELHAALARCIANCFTADDYERHTTALVLAGAPEKLASLVKIYNDTFVQRDAALVLAKLTEFRQDHATSEQVLKEVPLKELLELLDPSVEDTYDCIIESLTTLAKAGEETAVRQMFVAGAGKKLEQMLVSSSETAQERAVVALKSFNELGGSRIIQSFLRSGVLERIPWQLRVVLERLTAMDKKSSFNKRSSAGPLKRYQVTKLVNLLKEGSESDQLNSLDGLADIVDRAGNDQQILDVMLSTNPELVEALVLELGYGGSYDVKSAVCFVLAKLSTVGGPKCIKLMVKMGVLDYLVHMIRTGYASETAYSALHSLIFHGKRIVIEQLLRASLVEKLVAMLESGLDFGLLCVQDLAEFGGKECIERLLTLRVVDKLAALDQSSKNKSNTNFSNVLEFAKLVRNCSGLSTQEHRVLNQQLLRQARGVLKDPKQMTKLNSLLRINNDRGEGSGSSSGSSKRRNSFASSSSG